MTRHEAEIFRTLYSQVRTGVTAVGTDLAEGLELTLDGPTGKFSAAAVAKFNRALEHVIALQSLLLRYELVHNTIASA